MNATAKNAVKMFKICIESGSPAIFPTDTIYGLGAPISAVNANKKIYELKERPEGKPFPILIGSIEQLSLIAKPLTDYQISTLKKHWPGAYTFILEALPSLDKIYTLDGKVGVRLPNKDWMIEALTESGPVSATSANLSGQEYDGKIETLQKLFDKQICGMLVSKTIENNKPSTVVDISNDSFTILR